MPNLRDIFLRKLDNCNSDSERDEIYNWAVDRFRSENNLSPGAVNRDINKEKWEIISLIFDNYSFARGKIHVSLTYQESFRTHFAHNHYDFHVYFKLNDDMVDIIIKENPRYLYSKDAKISISVNVLKRIAHRINELQSSDATD